MSNDLGELVRALAADAEAVCRHYLSNGRRQGRYWLVGDCCNTPGRSLFVRLRGPRSGSGAAGKWTDAKTGEHGDLLDIIRSSSGYATLSQAIDEARDFLSMPRPKRETDHDAVPVGSPESARRLFAMANPIAGTLAEAYLKHRQISTVPGPGTLRFHPRCYYRPDEFSPMETWPAMIAAVTDLNGNLTGVHRTWLDPKGNGKAPIETPRRASGYLLGNAVRFGIASDILVAGEGIETILSLRSVTPDLPMAACLSAAHLGALQLPPTLTRIYVARDNDPAGDQAFQALTARAAMLGIHICALVPGLDDFNEDLCAYGARELRDRLIQQMVPQDIARFIDPC